MKRALRRGSDEAGWTLIELLVAMSIFTFAMGAALSLFETNVKSAPKEIEKAAAIRDAQVGLAGMVREIRDAYDIVEMTPSVVDFLAMQRGTPTHVRYECGLTDTEVSPPLTKCVRSQGAVAEPLPAFTSTRTAVGRMLNGDAASPVFDYTPLPPGCIEPLPCVEPPDPEDDPLDLLEPPPPTWPTYIAAKVKIAAKGRMAKSAYTHNISFRDAIYLRNLEAKQSPYNTGG